MTNITFSLQDIFDRVKAETIEKVFESGAFDIAMENTLRAEFSLVSDHEYWFNIYLRESANDVVYAINTINRMVFNPITIADDNLIFAINLKNKFDFEPLKECITKYIVSNIVARWYIYKEKDTIATKYIELGKISLLDVRLAASTLYQQKNVSKFYGVDYDTSFTFSCISNDENLGTTIAPAAGKYIENEEFELEAVNDAKSIFKHWIVNGQQLGIEKKIKIKIDKNTNVQAIFEYDMVMLCYSTDNSIWGTIACDIPNGEIRRGTLVRMSLNLEQDKYLDRWEYTGIEPEIEGNNEITFAVGNENINVNAILGEYVFPSAWSEVNVDTPNGEVVINITTFGRGKLQLDFGDGSPYFTSENKGAEEAVIIRHTYASAGNRTIRTRRANGEYKYGRFNEKRTTSYHLFGENSIAPDYITQWIQFDENNIIGLRENSLEDESYLYYKGITANMFSINNTGIHTIRFGSQLNRIGVAAFKDDLNRVSIVLPDNVKSIEPYAFYNCANLTSINFGNGVQYIKDSAFCNCKLTSISLPDSMIEIIQRSVSSNEGVFYDCPLTSLSLGNGIQQIGVGVFGNTNTSSKFKKTFTSIVLPNSLVEIGDSCFSNIKELVSIQMPNSLQKIGAGAFTGAENLSSLTLPSTISIIGRGAFSGLKSITNIVVPPLITSLDNTFSGCTSLANISLPNGLLYLKNGVFSGCTSLANISLPSSLERIEGNGIVDSVFYNCQSLDGITIPANVSRINNLFYGEYEKLSFLKIEGLIPPDMYNLWGKKPALIEKILVPPTPVGVITAYKNNVNWNQYSDIIEAWT